MKKFIIFLILLHYNCCFAQKISLDRMEDDGRRQLMSSSYKEKLDGAEYSFTIKVFQYEEYFDWGLLVSSYNYIPKNAIILLKLDNEDIINIPINSWSESKIDIPSTYGYLGTINYYTALFELTENEFNLLKDHGILKIRISSRNSFNEKIWKKDKLGRFINKCRDIMTEQFTTTKVKSIHDDF